MINRNRINQTIDDLLWMATMPAFTSAHQTRLSELKDLAAKRPLLPDEQLEQETLLDCYHRSVLNRALAFTLLSQRGYQIPKPSDLPRPS